MAVVPTGFENTRLLLFQEMVSLSSNFQTLVGAADAAAALPFILLKRSVPATAPAFFCLIALGRHATRNHGTTMHHSGSVLMRFQGEIPEAYLDDATDAENWFLNVVDPVIEDVFDVQNTAGYPKVSDFSREERPMISDPKQAGASTIRGKYEFDWSSS